MRWNLDYSATFRKTRQLATSAEVWARLKNGSEIRSSSGIIWKMQPTATDRWYD